MKNTRKMLAILFVLLLSNMVPVGASFSHNFDKDSGTMIFVWTDKGGYFEGVYVLGENVAINVLLWKINYGPLSNQKVNVTIEGPETQKKIVVETNELGFATLTLRPETPGYYSVEVSYGDLREWDWFSVVKIEKYYFYEHKRFYLVNSSVQLGWVLVDPYTRLPYNGEVNIYIPRLLNKTINVTNGVLNYTLVIPNISEYYGRSADVYLDGRDAGRVYLMTPRQVDIIGPHRVTIGRNYTWLITFTNPLLEKPIPAYWAILSIKYPNGTLVEENISMPEGYYLLILQIPNETGYMEIGVHVPDYQLGGYVGSSTYIDVVAPPVPAPEPGIKEEFKITPQTVFAKPGESIAFSIEPPKDLVGERNLTIEWYYWEGRDWDYEYGQTVKVPIYFNGSPVVRRIKVPELAYWGVVRIGNAVAWIYVVRPTLWTWTSVEPSISWSNGTIILGNETVIRGHLQNSTYRGDYKDKPLRNETVYVFYCNRSYTAITDEDGYYRLTLPYKLNNITPPLLEWGMSAITLLSIHKSGAWDIDDVSPQIPHVFFEFLEDGILIRNSLGWRDRASNIPTGIEIWKGGRLIGATVLTENSTLIKTNVEPGTYYIYTPHLAYMCHEYSCSYPGAHISILPENTTIPRGTYYSPTSTNVPIPFRIPGKGVAFLSFYFRGETKYYFVETNESGYGEFKISLPGVENRVHLWAHFGFVTEDFGLIQKEAPITIVIEKDTMPPRIIAEAVPEVQEVGKNATVKFSITDNGGIDTIKIKITNYTQTIRTIEYKVNGVHSFSGSVEVPIKKLEDYLVEIWANDTSGNSNSKLVPVYSKAVKVERVQLNGTKEVKAEKATLKISSIENKTVEMNVTVASGVTEGTMKVAGYEDLAYIKVETNETVKFNWVILNITYDESLLKSLGIPESAVKLFYWNGTEWVDLEKNVGRTIPDNSSYGNITIYDFGRDSVHNYVWANVSHLSDYAVMIKLPDLTITNVTPTTALVGQETKLKVYVKNLGGDAGKFSVAVFINGSLLDVKTVQGIKENEEVEVEFTWKPETPGTYEVKAVVDYYDDVKESNEDNNEFTSEIKVTVPKIVRRPEERARITAYLNLIYYRYYNTLLEEFNKAYKEALAKNVSNETIAEALKYKEEAEKYYGEAEKFGPIIANLWNPAVLPYLRTAYIYMKKATDILLGALS
ncbi:CARDB domain-containing protein [Pyrococcus kukulkanii]|uniref:CARDB domain-containing protein n=1 Tax=Pyrococcus kukulkanii TaxID=1609559 RepID=UPI003568EDAE